MFGLTFSKRYSSLFFLIFICIFLTYSVEANTYYVATWGSNSSAGSLNAPWRDIQYALNNILNGDTVVVENGTYSQNLSISKNNTLLTSNSSTRPVLLGSSISIDSRVSNVTINFFEISNFSANSSLVGTGVPGVIAYAATSGPGGTGFVFANSTVKDAVGYGDSVSCIYVRNTARVIIENNFLSNCSQAGINIASGYSTDNTYSNGIIIRNNTITNNHVDGIDILGQFFTIDRNTISKNINLDWAATHPDGIQFIKSTVDGRYSVQNVVLSNNVINDHTQNVFIESDSNGTNMVNISVYNNIIYNTPGIINGVNISEVNAKNIAAGGVNISIHHNTIGYSPNVGINIGGDNNSIYNNIIINNSVGVWYHNTSFWNSQTADYNLFYGNDRTVDWGDNGGSPLEFGTTLSAFQLSHLQEAHSLEVNPQIYDFPNPYLLYNSPAINRGINLSLLFALDVNDTSRPQGSGWDIGAYEYLFSRPLVYLNSPYNYVNTSNFTVLFNCSAEVGESLSNITLYGNWSGTWQANQTINLTGTSNSTIFTKNLTDGIYSWSCFVYDNHSSGSFSELNYTLNIDSSSPRVTLISPSNNSAFNSSYNVGFIFNVTDTGNIKNCSLYLDSISSVFSSNISLNLNQTLNYSLNTRRSYNWSVSCYDFASNLGTSAVFNFSFSYNDSSPPLVNFVYPTRSNGSITAIDLIESNVSAIEYSNYSLFVDFNRSLRLWLPFDKLNSSNNPTDISSYSLNASSSVITTSASARGVGVKLNGVSDYVVVPTSQQLNLTSKTISAWINVTGFKTYNMLYEDTDTDYFGFNSQDIRLLWINSTGSQKSTSPIGFLSTNQILFITIVYNVTGNNVNISIYKNGFIFSSVSNTEGLIPSPIKSIGSRTDGSHVFNGTIDEFMIFDRVLGASEIQAIYSGPSVSLYSVFTNLSNNTYQIKPLAIDFLGNINDSANYLFITVNTSADINYPIFSSFMDNNASLINQGLASFNVSVSNTNGTVFLELNNINYSASNLSLSNYNATINLSNGTYNYKWISFGNGSQSNLNASSIFSYTINNTLQDSIAPNVTISYPSNTTYNTNVSTLNYTCSDGVYALYSRDNFATNSSIVACGTNFTNVISIQGSNTWKIAVNDSLGNVNITNVTFFVDTTHPQFTNYFDNSGGLTDSGTARFNVTLANTNGTVKFYFNGVNYTAPNVTSTVYFMNLTISSSGDYTYYWISWSNSSLKNMNISVTRTYSVLASSSDDDSSSSSGGGGASKSDEPLVYTAADDKIQTGYTKLFKANSKIKFKFEDESHEVLVDDVQEDFVEVVVSSTPQRATIYNGQEKLFNLDGDDYFDLIVKVGSISGKLVNMTIKQTHELIPKSATQQAKVNSTTTQNSSANPEQKNEESSMLRYWWIILVVIAALAASYLLIKEVRKRKYN
ncbi:MAG TPA: LamG-like jellyroll fold domain-containing protein [Candidatus Nanoarchaeia archaeon]|nr:LamG-like jellyroll fold domain-containing protein [Candidatus Nanoarchaeia archaeon]